MIANPAIYSIKPSGYFSIEQVKDIIKEHAELVLLVLFVIGYQFYAQRLHQETMRVIEQPRQSDFFYVDYFSLNKQSDTRHRYVPLKVVQVDSTSVTFKVGNIAHSTPVSPRGHAKGDAALARNYYRKDTLTLSRSDIAALFESGVIYDARRPKTIFIDGWVVIPEQEMFLED